MSGASRWTRPFLWTGPEMVSAATGVFPNKKSRPRAISGPGPARAPDIGWAIWESFYTLGVILRVVGALAELHERYVRVGHRTIIKPFVSEKFVQVFRAVVLHYRRPIRLFPRHAPPYSRHPHPISAYPRLLLARHRCP